MTWGLFPIEVVLLPSFRHLRPLSRKASVLGGFFGMGVMVLSMTIGMNEGASSSPKAYETSNPGKFLPSRCFPIW